MGVLRRAAATCTLESSFGLAFSERTGLTVGANGQGAMQLVHRAPIFAKPLINSHELHYALSEAPSRVRVLESHNNHRHALAQSEFKRKHLPNARLFDLDTASRRNTPLPKM